MWINKWLTAAVLRLATVRCKAHHLPWIGVGLRLVGLPIRQALWRNISMSVRALVHLTTTRPRGSTTCLPSRVWTQNNFWRATICLCLRRTSKCIKFQTSWACLMAPTSTLAQGSPLPAAAMRPSGLLTARQCKPSHPQRFRVQTTCSVTCKPSLSTTIYKESWRIRLQIKLERCSKAIRIGWGKVRATRRCSSICQAWAWWELAVKSCLTTSVCFRTITGLCKKETLSLSSMMPSSAA